MNTEKTLNDPANQDPSATWPIQQNLEKSSPAPATTPSPDESSGGPAEQNQPPAERSR